MKLLQIHPTLFSFHGFFITTHGFFFALGAVIAAFFLISQRQFLELSVDDILEQCVVIFLAGLLGARLFYVVAYPDTWSNIYDLVALWHGGLVSYGGILGGLLAMVAYGHHQAPEKRLLWYSLVVEAGLLGWSVGRLGNYYAGESGGVASNFWHLTYGHIPIQLFEALGCLLLFLFLRYYKQEPLQKIWFGIGGYLVVRFLVDFWRQEASLGLHVSQWMTLVCFAALILVARKYHAKT